MEYTLNHKTREYEVYITIPSPGIKGPQNKLIGSFKTEIEIDGGINFANAKMAIEAGVDILVSGTTIFKENQGNLKKNIQLLKTK